LDDHQGTVAGDFFHTERSSVDTASGSASPNAQPALDLNVDFEAAPA